MHIRFGEYIVQCHVCPFLCRHVHERLTVLSENNASQTKDVKSVVGARLAVKLVTTHDPCKSDMDSKTYVSASLVHYKIIISCSIEV